MEGNSMSNPHQKTNQGKRARRRAAIAAQKKRQSKGADNVNSQEEENKQEEVGPPEAASAAMEVDEKSLRKVSESVVTPPEDLAPKDYAEKGENEPRLFPPTSEPSFNWKGIGIGLAIVAIGATFFYGGRYLLGLS